MLEPTRTIRRLLLTAKLYSVIGEVTRGVAFAYLLRADGTAAARAAGASLLLWLYFNWQSDAIQRDPGRPVAPRWLLVGLLTAAAGVGATWAAVGGVIGYATTIRLYSTKAGSAARGPLGPAFRVLTVAAHFALVWSITGGDPAGEVWAVVAALAFWIGTRNLIGDVRDVRTDQYEFPAQFGPRAALWAVRAGSAAGILAAAAAWQLPGVPAAVAVQAAAWAVTEWLAWRFGAGGAYLWGYSAHRVWVLGSVPVAVLIACGSGLQAGWALGLTMAHVVLHGTYGYIPGKRFPAWGELTVRGRL